MSKETTCEACGEECTKSKYMWNANYEIGDVEGNILLTDKMYHVMIKALNNGTIKLFGSLLELSTSLPHAVPVCAKCLLTENIEIPKGK